MPTPILFPALVRLDDKLVPAGAELVRLWGFRWEKANFFSYQESATHDDSRFHWLIDSNGQFREVRDIGDRRGWARGLKGLIRLTRRRCEIAPPAAINAGDLRGKLQGVSKSAHSRDLRALIDELGDEAVLSKKDFLKFMQEEESVEVEIFPSP